MVMAWKVNNMTTLQIVIIGAWLFAVATAISKEVSAGGMLLAWLMAIDVSIYGLVA